MGKKGRKEKRTEKKRGERGREFCDGSGGGCTKRERIAMAESEKELKRTGVKGRRSAEGARREKGKKNENERRGEIKALFRIIIAKQRETGLHASPDECSKQPDRILPSLFNVSPVIVPSILFSRRSGARASRALNTANYRFSVTENGWMTLSINGTK